MTQKFQSSIGKYFSVIVPAVLLASSASLSAELERVFADSFNGAVLQGTSPSALNTRKAETQTGTAAPSDWAFGYDTAGGKWQSANLQDLGGGTGVLAVQASKNSADGYGWATVNPGLQTRATGLGNHFTIEFRARQMQPNGDIVFAMGDKSFAIGNWAPNSLAADGLLQIRYLYTGRVLVDTGDDDAWDVNQTARTAVDTLGNFADFRIVGTPDGDGGTKVELFINNQLAVPSVQWARELESAPANVALASRGGSGSGVTVVHYDRFSIDIGTPPPFNPRPTMRTFEWDAVDGAELSWGGQDYQFFRVERSTDLVDWETIASGLSPNLYNHVVDSQASGMDRAFYRVGVDWLVRGNPLEARVDAEGNVELDVAGEAAPASGQFVEAELTVPRVPAGTSLHLVVAALGEDTSPAQILVDDVRVTDPLGASAGRFSFESGLDGWTDNFDPAVNRNGGVLGDASSYDANTPDGTQVAWLDQRGGGAAIGRDLGVTATEGTWTVRAAIGARNDLPLADGYALILMADTAGDGDPDTELGRFAGDTFNLALTQPEAVDLDTFRIDVRIDPVESVLGHDGIRAGITLGLSGADQSPVPDNAPDLISWTLSERESLEMAGPHQWREKRGYWEIWIDGVNRSLLPDPAVGDFSNGTGQLPYCFLPQDGPYHLRIVGVPQGEGSLLRFYFEDMLRPVAEYSVDRRVTPGNMAFFTEREEGRSGTARFSDFSVESMTEAEALALPDSRSFVMNLLDLDYPGLEAVKSAWLSGDRATAEDLFADYMRTRLSPTAPALDPTYYRSNYLEIADAACEGRYGETLWYAGPYVDMTYGPDDPRVHWELDAGYLNRMYHWVSMAKAYVETGDSKYPERFGFEVSDWVGREPFFRADNPFVGVDTMDGTQVRIGWLNTSNIGRRCEQTWWMSFEAMKSSPALSDEAIFKFLDSVIRQSRLIFNPSVFGVWDDGGAHVTAAILQNAAMFPECAEASEWRSLADARIGLVNEAQIYDDNSHASLSTGYGFAYFDTVYIFLDILNRIGEPSPTELLDTLERAYEWPMAISRPDRRLIELNDGNDIPVPASYYQRAFSLFPDRHDFEWFATGGVAGNPPGYESIYLENAGWITLRTGWGPEEKWLFMDAGPFGASHGKNDKLSVWLARGSKLLLQSGGRSPYGTAWTDYNNYTNSSRSQNVIHVDGSLQSRLGNNNSIYAYEAEQRRWFSDSSFDYGEGFYELGNNPFSAIGLWTRQIIHVKGNNPPQTSYFVVIDTLDPDDRGSHDFRSLFHSRCEFAEIAPLGDPVVELWDTGGSCRIIPVAGDDGLTASLIRGQEDPYLQGWHVTYEGTVNEAWCVAYDWTATDQTIKAWVLVPAGADRLWTTLSASDVNVDPGTGTLSAALQRADGGTDWVLRRAPGAPATTFAGVSVSGDVAVVRKDALGTIEDVFETDTLPALTAEESTVSQTPFATLADDLANQDQASFGGIGESDYSAASGAADLIRLFDGSAGSDGVLADVCMSEGDALYSFVLNFDLTHSPAGYDISEIRSLAGWLSQRARQNLVIEYQAVGESEFRFLARGRHGYFEISQPNASRLIWRHPQAPGANIATSVAALRFRMLDFGGTSGTPTALREIDVIGTPTTP